MSDPLAWLAPEARAALGRLVVEEVERQLREHGGSRARTTRSPYMTIAEAAEYLRCRRQRIDDLLSSGRLTRRKEGSRTLVLRDDIERHLR